MAETEKGRKGISRREFLEGVLKGGGALLINTILGGCEHPQLSKSPASSEREKIVYSEPSTVARPSPTLTPEASPTPISPIFGDTEPEDLLLNSLKRKGGETSFVLYNQLNEIGKQRLNFLVERVEQVRREGKIPLETTANDVVFLLDVDPKVGDGPMSALVLTKNRGKMYLVGENEFKQWVSPLCEKCFFKIEELDKPARVVDKEGKARWSVGGADDQGLWQLIEVNEKGEKGKTICAFSIEKRSSNSNGNNELIGETILVQAVPLPCCIKREVWAAINPATMETEFFRLVPVEGQEGLFKPGEILARADQFSKAQEGEIVWLEGKAEDVLYIPISEEKSRFVEATVEEIRERQKEALAAGKIKIPLPKSLIEAGGRVEVRNFSEYESLICISPPGKEIVVPALIEGTILHMMPVNECATEVVVGVGNNKILDFYFPRTGKVLVYKGQEVSLGTPLFSIQYLPKDEIQLEFGKGVLQGAIISLLIATGKDFMTASWENTNFDNILKRNSGEILLLSTLK